MTSLQLLWFCLIGLLFSIFFILEGFDYGVGMSVGILAHSDAERDQLIRTIGPHWDGNEVWLITAGGAMFASFPYWYASLFSGFYIILFLILFSLIVRGVSFEFRSHVISKAGKKLWEAALICGSLLTPFFFGMLFTDLVRGMPINGHGDVMASFGDYVNIFSIVGGIAIVVLCLLQGLNFIRLKTLGDVRENARKMAQWLYAVLFAGLVVYAVLLFFQTDFFTKRPVSSGLLVVALVLASAIAWFGVIKDHEWVSIIASSCGWLFLVALLFNGLFPRVMIGRNAAHSILIKNAASTEHTLGLMTIVAVILVPIVLIYVIWSYYIFRHRVAVKKVVL